jgi:mannose-6-phosphate isomerase
MTLNAEVAGKFVEKPWGRDVLPPPFETPQGRRIGEIWFEPPPEIRRLLAKYLFTSEKVSVQAHATDEQTNARGLGRQGKDECWLVIAAEAGACLGIGFDRKLARDDLRSAALDGSIEEMLVWFSVRPGDFFYIPANTVHAIGPGVTLLEVEQNSDLTYRLYDYGRPRELHLDDGLSVALGEPYPDHLHRHLPPNGETCLVEGPHFRLHRLDGPPSAAVVEKYAGRPLLAMPLSGEIHIGEARIGAGRCGAASDVEQVRFSPGSQCLVAQPLQD